MMIIEELKSKARFLSDANGETTGVLLVLSLEDWKALLNEMSLKGQPIIKTPGIVGGNARVAGTRLAVWGLEAWRRLGWSNEKILANYPQLSVADLANAWAYAEVHHDEIEAAIRLNAQAMETDVALLSN